MVQERERYLRGLFRGLGYQTLDGVKTFEAGCSTGYNLRLMVQWGARPEDQAGIDIDPVAIDYCRSRSPGMRIHCASAEQVAEPDEAFDFSLAFTLFSSVPDEDVARRIARELFRITRPGGLVIIYDMRRDNPRNANVHGIGADDVRRWFPHCPMRTRTMTLAPPIARRVGRWVPFFYGPLAAIPPLRTHAFYVLRRPALPPGSDPLADDVAAPAVIGAPVEGAGGSAQR